MNEPTNHETGSPVILPNQIQTTEAQKKLPHSLKNITKKKNNSSVFRPKSFIKRLLKTHPIGCHLTHIRYVTLALTITTTLWKSAFSVDIMRDRFIASVNKIEHQLLLLLSSFVSSLVDE